MKNKKDSLGDRMKDYEMVSRTHLIRRTPVIIRLDGKAFHTFTRGLDRPFDRDFLEIMQSTMLKLCENIQGCVLGYTQSDEITLVLVDYQNRDTSAWFDNQVQKMVSVAASMATLYFNEALVNRIEAIKVDASFDDMSNMNAVLKAQKYQLLEMKMWQAMFDARAFNLSTYEVCNNLIWRQQDATRNSILSVAQALYSHKEIEGIKCNDLQNKMLIEKNINWNTLPTMYKRGSCAIKDEEGKWFIDNEIPIFTEDREYIDKLIFLDDERR